MLDPLIRLYVFEVLSEVSTLRPSGGSGLCDSFGSYVRQGPEREVRLGPEPGGGRPRNGLLPPHD